jgi:protein-S-isoprenylcysteine O-methyltransferase Ste14
MHVLLFLIFIIFRKQFFSNFFYTSASILIIVFGLVIWIIAKKEMGKITINIIPTKLITTGIYSKIRHPLYLGVKLVFLGFALLFKSIIGIILVFIMLIPLHSYRAKKEEQELVKKFGKRYILYKKKTLF